MQMQVTDNHTGQNYMLDWSGDKPPTESELNEIFPATAAKPAGPTSFDDNPVKYLGEKAKDMAVGAGHIGRDISRSS